MDYKPRKFDAECCNILANFAEMVVRDAERYAAEDERAGLHRHIALKQVRLVAPSFNEAGEAPVCRSAHRVSACFLRLPLRCDTWNLSELVCSTHCGISMLPMHSPHELVKIRSRKPVVQHGSLCEERR